MPGPRLIKKNKHYAKRNDRKIGLCRNRRIPFNIEFRHIFWLGCCIRFSRNIIPLKKLSSLFDVIKKSVERRNCICFWRKRICHLIMAKNQIASFIFFTLYDARRGATRDHILIGFLSKFISIRTKVQVN